MEKRRSRKMDKRREGKIKENRNGIVMIMIMIMRRKRVIMEIGRIWVRK